MKKKKYNEWVNDNGDKTNRLDYNLNENSVVFDIGGYKGDWSEEIFNKYGCNIYIFEPILEFFQNIEKKFKGNSKIKVYNFGLSKETTKTEISLKKDSSSIFNVSGESETIQINDILDVFNSEKTLNVDLMKINIEGSEYDLLKRILFSKHNTLINNFQIQFHKNIPNHKFLRNQIREELKKTHKITYEYEYVWENWEKI